MIIKRNKGEDLPRGRELKFRDPYVYDYRKDGDEEAETFPDSEDDWNEEESEDEGMIENEK